MTTGRLEAFSDGVIAIIITIMVLEMKVPHGDGLKELAQLLPVFLSYILSFFFVGIYWNNHHHLLHACTSVTGQSPPAFLALPISVRRRVDGRKPLHGGAHCTLCHGAIDGRDRILTPPAGNHSHARRGFHPEGRARERLEGQALAGVVYSGSHRYTSFIVDRPRGSSDRRTHLAGSGPAYRKTSCRVRQLSDWTTVTVRPQEREAS